jgi:curved DNA-binding protein CbpA
MTDYFALLDEPRRPWLDAEELKVRFLTLSAQAHPDKLPAGSATARDSANRRFAELNSAFNCLREPKDRLRHLLELELGEKPKEVHEIPQDLADLFMEITRLRREVSVFLAETKRAQSPLLRVQVFEQTQEWIDRLRVAQARLGEWQAKLLLELRNSDQEWQRTADDPVQHGVLLQAVHRIHQRLSFYTRWSTDLQEVIIRLSF